MRTRVTSSSGRRTVFHCAVGHEEVRHRHLALAPRAEARSTRAPRVMSTGGVSAEWAATHFFPTRVTWQTSPSFFRQKPSACRQKRLWL